MTLLNERTAFLLRVVKKLEEVIHFGKFVWKL